MKIAAPYARFSGKYKTQQFIVLLLSLAAIGDHFKRIVVGELKLLVFDVVDA